MEAARLSLEHEYVADGDSPVSQVVPYYEIQDESLPGPTFMRTDEEAVTEVSEFYSLSRLDLVGLDADGEICVSVAAERVNNDHRRAVPVDLDKMAACSPDEAIWVAKSDDAAHEILAALNDPLESDPRVEKTYSESTSRVPSPSTNPASRISSRSTSYLIASTARIRVTYKASLGPSGPANQANTVLCRSGGVQPRAPAPQQGD